MAFADQFNTALSGLQNSTNNVPTPSYTQVGSYQAPTSTPLQLPTWNLTQSDFPSLAGGQAGQAQAGQGGGGFWNNVGSSIANGFNWMMNEGDKLGAGIRNEIADLPNLPNVMLQDAKSIFNPQPASSQSFADQLKSAFDQSPFGQGYNNPQSAVSGRQLFNQAVLGGNNIPYVSGAGGFLTDMATNPINYIPVPIGKVAQLTGLTPALKMGIDALKSTPVLDNKVVNGITDKLGSIFVKNYGASPDMVNALNQGEAAHSTDLNNITQTIANMAKTSGLSDPELQDIGHIIEGTKTGTPEQHALANQISDHLQNGISGTTGTNALLNSGLLEPGQIRPNYFPHFYNNVPDELKGVFPKSTDGIPGLSSNGTFQMPRTFDTLADAQGQGLKPELNPFLALGKSLANGSKAVINQNTVNAIKNIPGLMFDKDTVDNVAKLVKTGRMDANQAAQSLGMSLDDLQKGFVESSIPQLRGAYIRPQDEAALKNFLNPVSKNSLYDSALNKWKTLSTFNSLVHGHNVLYNGGYLGGANPSYVKEAFMNLKNGTSDPWLQKAMQDGAVSADRGGFMNNLKSTISNANNPLKDKISYALHGALWDLDKSMRTAIYRQAVEGGASGAEAAAKANKFLINYNNLTPFEQKIVTRIFPFYSWMKGNMPLQVEQWFNNTPKQMLYESIKNGVAQSLTGQGSRPDGKIDTGIKLPDGSHVLVDPYSPADDPLKLLNEGPLGFLYGKINPIVKEGIAQLTNHAYYPGPALAPDGKSSMADIPITKPGLPWQQNVGAQISHAANAFLPESGVLGGLASILGGSDAKSMVNQGLGQSSTPKPPQTPVELLTKALGGFTSRDNPAQDQYFQQKDAQTELRNQISNDKKQGMGVPKSLTKQAYKKIPYPQLPVTSSQ